MQATDAGKVVEKNGATTVIIPTDAAGSIPTGSVIRVRNNTSSGSVALEGPSVTVRSRKGSIVQDAAYFSLNGWEEVWLHKRGTNQWFADGTDLRFLPAGGP